MSSNVNEEPLVSEPPIAGRKVIRYTAVVVLVSSMAQVRVSSVQSVLACGCVGVVCGCVWLCVCMRACMSVLMSCLCLVIYGCVCVRAVGDRQCGVRLRH
jgi:hypothetical protein